MTVPASQNIHDRSRKLASFKQFALQNPKNNIYRMTQFQRFAFRRDFAVIYHPSCGRKKCYGNFYVGAFCLRCINCETDNVGVTFVSFYVFFKVFLGDSGISLCKFLQRLMPPYFIRILVYCKHTRKNILKYYKSCVF